MTVDGYLLIWQLDPAGAVIMHIAVIGVVIEAIAWIRDQFD